MGRAQGPNGKMLTAKESQDLLESIPPLESPALLFEECKSCIYGLMADDIYTRYRLSDEYKELVQVLVDRRHEHEVLNSLER
jgi:hypothetical protein